MSKAGNLLRQAKALISDPKDWTQEGVYETSDGCMCAKGAINRAWSATSTNEIVIDNATACMHKALRKLHPYILITRYNDDFETTHTDIMNLFDASAAIADEITT